MSTYSDQHLEPQAEDDQQAYEQHVHEVLLHSLEVSCRELLKLSPAPINERLHLLIENLALALHGCPTCAQVLGERHGAKCRTLRGERVLVSDLDSKLRENAPKAQERPF